MTFYEPMRATIRGVLLSGALVASLGACAAGSGSPASPSAAPTAGVASAAPSTTSASAPATEGSSPSADPAASQEPDTGAGTTIGDVPDNAVFLTFKDSTAGFSIQYVEGWQVTRDPGGVTIRDKDSSEVIQIGPAQTDVASYVSSTDLPALRRQAGFQLARQDTVKVGAHYVVHLVFDLPSAPDAVTGKQVPSTVDRYYIPGPNALAIVSLSTPKGVDNVDAFRQMIESFAWA